MQNIRLKKQMMMVMMTQNLIKSQELQLTRTSSSIQRGLNRMDELWAASLLLDIAAKQDAEALAEEETAEDDVAKQLRSMREAMDNGPIDCLLKVRKYAEMLLQDHEARGPAAAAPEHRDGDKPSQGDPPKPAHLSHGSCPSCSKGCSSCYCSYHI